MPTVQVPSGPKLAYDEHGDAEGGPVVLLHGLSDSRTTWTPIVPEIADGHRVLVVDQRGHGDSDRTPDAYRVEDYASDLEAFVRDVAGEPVALVGHSLGGLVADHFAATRPDLVRSAFLEDPPLFMGDKELFDSTMYATFFPLLQSMLREMRDADAPVEAYIEAIGNIPALTGEGSMADAMGEEGTLLQAETWRNFDPDAFSPAIDGTLFDGYDPAREVSCPVRVLRADPDLGPAFFPEHKEPFLATRSKASVEMVPGASHLIHDEQPELFVKSLRSFLT